MPIPLSAVEVLDREFLQVRARILEVAAAFDRLGRASEQESGGQLSGGQVSDSSPVASEDTRLAQLQQALRLLERPSNDRAEQVQLLFSRTYDAQWRTTLKVDTR